jgi:hypothetical protein
MMYTLFSITVTKYWNAYSIPTEVTNYLQKLKTKGEQNCVSDLK